MRTGKNVAPLKKVELDKENKTLIITIPIDENLPLSSTGKTHIVYTTRYPHATDVFINGREVHVTLTAFIGRE